MARTYGAIYTNIWRNQDWRTLGHAEQYLYMALVSQAKLNRAGLLEYSPRRWAEACGDLTPAEVEVAVKNLEQRRYVVLDESTNELLIRTYVRNDGAWKQPKVMASVVSAANEIDSPKLRRALLLELDRIPVHELSDTPAANGSASIRAKVENCIAQLRVILDDGEPDDPGRQSIPNPDQPDADPSGNAGVPIPQTSGTDRGRVGSGTRARARPAPEPAPTPEPEPRLVAAAVALAHPEALFEFAATPPASPDRPDSGQPAITAGSLLAEWLEYRGEDRPSERIIGRVGKHLKELLAEGINPVDVRQGFIDWEKKGADPAALPSFVNGATARRRAQTASGPRSAVAAPRPSTTTRIVDQGVELIRKMAEEDGVDLGTLIPVDFSQQRRELTA